jgi:type II secretory pathway pseudopilin PulG
MKNFKKRHGYSLIETVVYIGLIAVMLVVSVSSIISVYRTFGILRIERQISLNGDAAMETMIRDIRLATSTVAVASVFGQSPGVLRIGTTTYSLIGTELRQQKGDELAQSITGNNVRITNLIFYHDTTPFSEIVTIRMTVAAGTGVYSKSKQYFGSAVLRGSYK